MAERRFAGVLLHPSSLPGRFGIGDIGPEAEGFLDWAASARFGVWQVLPLGPTAAGDSPYGSPSAFAGNPDLISPERLVEDGLLPEGALHSFEGAPTNRIDHSLVARKRELVRSSWEHGLRSGPSWAGEEFDAFRAAPEQAAWLEDWALYAALKDRNEGREWLAWERSVRLREPESLARAKKELAQEIERHAWLQFLFFRQWARLRAEALTRGVRIFGDVPIYVALDSVDVWAHQDLFHLDEDGWPTVVAGVPPDYFSATGQLWGNPLYRWDRMEADGFRWWMARLRANARLADAVRLDHFRGFAAYWEVKGGEPDARGGRWVPAPGDALFEKVRSDLPGYPVVAEDLGMITEDVRALRKKFGFPGMRVLQFGFDGSDNDHVPHRHAPDAVVYTGTHDNDTTRGWIDSLDDASRGRVLDYLGVGAEDAVWGMIRQAYTSVARACVVPVQDMLELGTEARMNTPGVPRGNWAWRLAPGELDPRLSFRLARLAEITARLEAE